MMAVGVRSGVIAVRGDANRIWPDQRFGFGQFVSDRFADGTLNDCADRVAVVIA